MQGTDKVIQKIETEVRKRTRARAEAFAKTFLREAVMNRLRNDYAHNFTGNLVDSICTIVCEDGNPIKAFFAEKELNLKAPISNKMTTTASGNARKYRFNPDWQGAVSQYKADMTTDNLRGVENALKLYATYQGSKTYMFEILLAYPVEYANYIEAERETTGYLETIAFADQYALAMLSNNFSLPNFEDL